MSKKADIAKELEQTVLKDFVKPFVKESFNTDEKPIPMFIAVVLIIFSIVALLALLVIIPYSSYKYIKSQKTIMIYTIYFLYYGFVLAMFTKPLYLYILFLYYYIFENHQNNQK
jgi:uncharacterized membrane protein